mgnify:CR=1 FL=1
MAFRLKITDRYILKEFFSVFFYVLCACAIVLLISRIFDEFDDVMESALPLGTAARYFLLMLPFRLLEVVPLATVLAVIFSMGTLARNREMLAITAGGQSPYRSAVPVLVGTLGIAVAVLMLNETFVPYCQEMVRFIKEVRVDGESELSLVRRQHVFDKGIGRTFFMAREFDSRRNRLYEVKVFEQYGDKGWRWCMTAERGDLIEKSAEPGRDRWRFEKATVLSLIHI